MTILKRRGVVYAIAALLAVTAVVRLVHAQQAIDPTVAMLVDLIRIDTSNPPGNEAAIAEYLAPKLKAAGFEVDVIQTPTPGKAVLIARLKGDGSKRPLLLAAHADVVGVEREKWSVDPFAGLIRDGYVFGRGAIDFKGGMAVFVRAAMMLAENKVPLARDVIVLAEADEEGGLTYSTPWLAENYWPKIDCEFALNEGGWIIKGRDGRVQYVSISTADKLSLPIVMTARGTSTHSSMPRPDSAIFALSRALARLADHETELKLIPSTRQFFQTLARTSSEPMATQFRNLTGSDPARVREADREISKDPLLHAIMRNTIAPVIMNAGFRSNVIPGSADVTINVRLIPGTDPMDMVGEIQRVIADPKIEVRWRHVQRSSWLDSLFGKHGSDARASAGVAPPVSGRRGDALLVSGGDRRQRLALSWDSGVRHLPVSDRRRRSFTHARQRRTCKRGVAEAGDADDLSDARRRRRPPVTSIYDIDVATIDGARITLNTYEGRTLLIVNVASRCGYTRQYAGLEAILSSTRQSIAILGFPHQFGHQELRNRS